MLTHMIDGYKLDTELAENIEKLFSSDTFVKTISNKITKRPEVMEPVSAFVYQRPIMMIKEKLSAKARGSQTSKSPLV